jgi:hypothetical protein
MQTKFNPRHIINNELPRIRSALTVAEKGLTFGKIKLISKEEFMWAHPTAAPNGGWYLRTDIHELNSFLSKWDFNGISALDLGGGFGAASFVMSLYCERTAMMEADPHLLIKAEKIKKALGSPYNGVQMYCGDFLKLGKQLLKEFDLLYFFLPFADDLTRLMEEFIRNTVPGQTVLTYKLTDAEMAGKIFPKELFERMGGNGFFVPYIRLPD